MDMGGEGEEEEPTEEEEEPEAPPEGYRVLVTVSDPKLAKVMQVGAFVTDHMRIHRVTMYAAGEEPSADAVFGGMGEPAAYSGPAFDELDNALQNAFYEYMADRGIDDALATKLSDFCSNKEQLEYVKWLETMKAFAQGSK